MCKGRVIREMATYSGETVDYIQAKPNYIGETAVYIRGIADDCGENADSASGTAGYGSQTVDYTCENAVRTGAKADRSGAVDDYFRVKAVCSGEGPGCKSENAGCRAPLHAGRN
jgi:hypothetical protein